MINAGATGFEFLDIDRALEQLGEVAALHEMLEMLQATLDRDVVQIRQLLALGDVKAANLVLHSLKGFIPIFCRESLCEHVAAVEMLSKTAAANEVALAYAALEPKLQQLQSEIDAHRV